MRERQEGRKQGGETIGCERKLSTLEMILHTGNILDFCGGAENVALGGVNSRWWCSMLGFREWGKKKKKKKKEEKKKKKKKKTTKKKKKDEEN